uniref:Uncharacterized 11.1 kDa protein in Gp30-rIII intergenic region n=1 Tax=Enterobacteria phage T4 TaxID=10665 RepID=Y13A_BPT4|nr:RecName: Full=Uncharacterized 11.1 kDa protein in Gp30-rIII intergenic region; AltName: Full=ORF D [Tequatrovirus T4]CAA35653.1 unnamed protein product [Tequatrovirus T4]
MMTGLWLSWSLNIQKPMFPLRLAQAMPISPAFSFKREFIMAKQAKAKKAVEKKVGDSKRAGYKRGSNSRINQTVEKIMRRARAVLRDDASRFGKQKA